MFNTTPKPVKSTPSTPVIKSTAATIAQTPKSPFSSTVSSAKDTSSHLLAPTTSVTLADTETSKASSISFGTTSHTLGSVTQAFRTTNSLNSLTVNTSATADSRGIKVPHETSTSDSSASESLRTSTSSGTTTAFSEPGSVLTASSPETPRSTASASSSPSASVPHQQHDQSPAASLTTASAQPFSSSTSADGAEFQPFTLQSQSQTPLDVSTVRSTTDSDRELISSSQMSTLVTEELITTKDNLTSYTVHFTSIQVSATKDSFCFRHCSRCRAPVLAPWTLVDSLEGETQQR